MPDVTVRPVASRRDRKRFIDFPYTLYRDHPYWVPPLRLDTSHTLDPKKNPFYEHGEIQLFLAEDATGTVVGRIAAIVNGMHLAKYDDGVGFFGFFECAERYDVAEALFDAAGSWLRTKGLTAMRGPANPSLNDTAGLLIDGFDRRPSLLMPYNPPYYETYLRQHGFEQVMKMWAYYVHEKYVNTAKLRRGAGIVRRRNPGLTLRPLQMDQFDTDAQTILDIYNDAWSENWGHVPMTEAEFANLAKDLKQIVDPRMVFLLEDNGTPVAFSISLPDMNQALVHVTDGRLFPFGLIKLLGRTKLGGISEVRMPLMGVRQSHQGRGLDALLILETIEQGPRLGYFACEMSWVLEKNKVLLNALDALGGTIDKTYGMYERALASPAA